MKTIMVLIGGLALALAAMAAPEAKAPSVFWFGVTQQDVLATLGKPTSGYPRDRDGKELWYFGKAVVTFLDGKVIS